MQYLSPHLLCTYIIMSNISYHITHHPLLTTTTRSHTLLLAHSPLYFTPSSPTTRSLHRIPQTHHHSHHRAIPQLTQHADATHATRRRITQLDYNSALSTSQIPHHHYHLSLLIAAFSPLSLSLFSLLTLFPALSLFSLFHSVLHFFTLLLTKRVGSPQQMLQRKCQPPKSLPLTLAHR